MGHTLRTLVKWFHGSKRFNFTGSSSALYLIGDAARVGYFVPLNGPLNGHPPSNLLRSYLANRKQFVELNDTASKTLPIVTGVPQGSILGPLLFLIYIHYFPKSSNLFKFIVYADDTTLCSQFDNARIANHDIELEINNELTNINDWLKINKLALNKKIYKYMISTKAHSEPKKLELKIVNKFYIYRICKFLQLFRSDYR